MASVISRRFLSTTARRMESKSGSELKKESKRNPEIIVLGSVMVATLGAAGFYFGSSPTGSTDERPVKMSEGGMPWEGEGGAEGKYKYHPGGDANQAPRSAPSALNTVIVPNVTLPRELHDQFNKWGKDGY